MGNIVDVDLKVDPEYLSKSAEKIVKAGIIEALGDPSQILKAAIDSVISRKVDRDGRESTSYSARPYLDWLAAKVVEDTVRDCLKEVIEERKEEFEQAIKAQLSSKKFIKDTAARFIQAMIDASESRWTMPIDVSFKQPED